MPLRAVIFDLGDTIWPLRYEEEIWPITRVQMIEDFARLRGQTEEAAAEDVDRLRKTLGAVFVDTFLGDNYEQLHLHHYVEKAMTQMGIEGEGLGEAICHAFYMAEHKSLKVAPEADTIELLADLRERGLLLGLVSNTFSPGHFHQLSLHRHGVASFFDAPVYSTDMGFRKPDPRIYQHCLVRLGVVPGETLFIGDRLKEDVRGPQSLGIKAALYRRYRREEPTAEIVPDFVTETPADILAAVDSLSPSVPRPE